MRRFSSEKFKSSEDLSEEDREEEKKEKEKRVRIRSSQWLQAKAKEAKQVSVRCYQLDLLKHFYLKKKFKLCIFSTADLVSLYS